MKCPILEHLSLEWWKQLYKSGCLVMKNWCREKPGNYLKIILNYFIRAMLYHCLLSLSSFFPVSFPWSFLLSRCSNLKTPLVQGLQDKALIFTFLSYYFLYCFYLGFKSLSAGITRQQGIDIHLPEVLFIDIIVYLSIKWLLNEEKKHSCSIRTKL